MDYQRFLRQLPEQYSDWGKDTIQPRSPLFQAVLNQIQGMTTANVMQLLNRAVACMAPGEIYCEVGTYQGSTLVGAMLGQHDRMAYAIDNFSEFDADGSCLASLLNNLSHFGIDEQVYFCNQDFQQFFLELQELGNEDKIGVYFYDGAHDYRSTLMGLLLAKPFLADTAVIILDDANWKTVQQACWDFLAVSPEAAIALELFTPVARFSTFWNGIQILSWDRTRQENYSSSTFSQRQQSSVVQAIYNLQLLEQREESIELLLQEARHYHQQKQFGEAEKKYQEFLLWRDRDAQAWQNLGALYYETSDFQQSLKALLKAADYSPDDGYIYYSIGCVLEQLDQNYAAIAAYQKAIELKLDLIDAYNNLGNVFNQIGNLEQAEAVYRQAIEIAPDFPGSYLNLGNISLEKGDLGDAIAAYQFALRLDPEDELARQNLETAYTYQNDVAAYHQAFAQQLLQAKKLQLALKHFQIYLSIQPGSSNFYAAFSDCLSQLNRTSEALHVLQAGIAQHPESERLHYELSIKLLLNNQTSAAISAAEAALEKLPNSYTFSLIKALALPLVYGSEEEIITYRDRYTQELLNLIDHTSLETQTQQQNALAGIGRFTSFYLTYQARSMIVLQQHYSRLLESIMSANYPQWSQPVSMPPVGSKIRIGYLSHYFHSYSGTLWLTGWLQHCDHNQFEVYCYYTGNSPDPITQEFQRYSHRFHHIAGDLEAVCQQVLADRLHILVFPEIGMDPAIVRLAALRLAPVQCTAWGHPVTSGLSTIDYYLSSELMEPDNAQEEYSEQLVLLPKLGISYPQPILPPLTLSRSHFGLRSDTIVYLCIQAPFKYLPQHDYLLIEIAKRVPNSQFVFIRAEMLQPRLKNAFDSANLSLEEFCVFLPIQPRNDYLVLNQLADVYLDTLGFTGGNTTMDAVACGLPVVTLPGEFMRGRLSYGILQALGVTDTIAQTEAEYIEIAVKLGENPVWRTQISAEMQHNQANVFDDQTCIPALDRFYQRAVTQATI